jgi:hypothetical protein
LPLASGHIFDSEALRIVMALLGLLSIFLGYRLFCGLAGESRRWSRLLTNLVAGALLALFGVGILIADIRGISATASDQRPEWQRKSSQQDLQAPGKHSDRQYSTVKFV